MLNAIIADLQAPFAYFFLNDGVQKWILKFMQLLTPQAMMVVHEL